MTQESQISDADPVLRVKQVADLLDVSPDTVLRRAADGSFEGAYRTRRVGGQWRIPTSAVRTFKLKNSPQQPQTSSSGQAPHGDSSGPDPQEGDASAEMPAGSFDTNGAAAAQEA
ncbi:MAG: helix-turn-helix domain-containing protein [Phycisphaera sp.]|nr:MAG: helix-turn-helix domain-containing protein [Phycisphaera sp.]